MATIGEKRRVGSTIRVPNPNSPIVTDRGEIDGARYCTLRTIDNNGIIWETTLACVIEYNPMHGGAECNSCGAFSR